MPSYKLMLVDELPGKQPQQQQHHQKKPAPKKGPRGCPPPAPQPAHTTLHKKPADEAKAEKVGYNGPAAEYRSTGHPCYPSAGYGVVWPHSSGYMWEEQCIEYLQEDYIPPTPPPHYTLAEVAEFHRELVMYNHQAMAHHFGVMYIHQQMMFEALAQLDGEPVPPTPPPPQFPPLPPLTPPWTLRKRAVEREGSEDADAECSNSSD
eukprot:Sspe_Gene.32885::Locus_16099_Transcript_1_1_Confidence_1.000_Length_748::g.32885::m.32885